MGALRAARAQPVAAAGSKWLPHAHPHTHSHTHKHIHTHCVCVSPKASVTHARTIVGYGKNVFLSWRHKG